MRLVQRAQTYNRNFRPTSADRRFGFDVLVAEDDSELSWKYVRFYSQTRDLPQATKGLLRIEL